MTAAHGLSERVGHSRAVPHLRVFLDEIGITYRQFDYWCSAGIIPIENPGTGNFRTLTADEEAAVRDLAILVRAGMIPSRAARIVWDCDTEAADAIAAVIGRMSRLDGAS